MKKNSFLVFSCLISLTLTGCGSNLRQGDQSEPIEAPAATQPIKTSNTEMDSDVTDESAPGYSTTPSGLKYKIVREGSDKKPGPTDKVTVHYRGTLENGTEFDSSYARGETISFPLNGVIKGWTEGLQLIGEGGEVELIIPPDLGYGAAGAPPVIPGGATLHFKVELFKVN